ncbi:MAG: T9SS type A sorting domain-containing protein [Candidatus Kapaibacterium sp.]
MRNRTLSLVAGFICTLTLQLSAQSSSDIEWMIVHDTAVVGSPIFSTEGTYIQCLSDRYYDNKTLTRYYYIYEAANGRLAYQFQKNLTPLYFLTDTTLLVYDDILLESGKHDLLLQEMSVNGEILRPIDTISSMLYLIEIQSNVAVYTAGEFGYPSIYVRDIFTGETIVHSYDAFFQPGYQNFQLLAQGERCAYTYQGAGGYRFGLKDLRSAAIVLDQEIMPTIIRMVCIPKSGKFAALIGADFFVRVLHFESGIITRQIQSSKLFTPLYNSITASKISPNETYFAASIYDDGTISLWNLWTGKEIHTFDAYPANHYTLDFSPDGKHLLSTTADGAIIMWKMPEGTTGVEEEKHRTRSSELASSALYNPTTERINVRFLLPEHSDVQIDFYTLRGERIGQVHRERMEEGENRVEWNAAKLPEGAYFYRISAEGFAGMGKFLVQF